MPVPIHDHLRALEKALSDAEWAGDEAQTKRLRSEIERVRADIKRGELWEVPF